MGTGTSTSGVSVVALADDTGNSSIAAVLSQADGVSVRRCADTAELRETLETAPPDRVVVHHDADGVETVAAVGAVREGRPELPVTVVTDRTVPDGVFGPRTTVVPAADTDGLVSAIRDTAAAGRPADEGLADGRHADDATDGRHADDLAAFRDLHEITADPEHDVDERIDRLLRLGATQFGTDYAFLARADRDTGEYEVTASLSGHDHLEPGAVHDLSDTYCRHVIEGDRETPATTHDTRAALSATDPAHEQFGLGCHVAAEIAVDGEVYGTLCFAADEPRAAPFSATERRLLQTMADWLGQTFERQRREAETRETRDRLARISERVTDAFFAVDEDWHVTYVNEAGAAVLRGAMGADYTESELLGRHLWEEIPQAVDTEFYAQYTHAMETGEPVSFESEYAPLDTWFDVRAFPDEDGLSVYFTDVTDRKRRERALDALLTASRAFMLADDETELADRVIAAAQEAFGHSLASVRLHDEEAGTLPPTRLSEHAAEVVPDPPTFADDEGLAGRAFQSGEPVVVDDVTAETTLDYGPVASAMYVPLGDHGTVAIGAEEPAVFDDQLVSLAELLAVTAASAFDRLARETELRDLQRAVANVDEMVFLLDGDGRFRLATDRLADALGYGDGDLAGTRLADVVVPEDAATCGDHVETLRDAAPPASVSFETGFTTATGQATPVEIELSAVSTPHGGDRIAGAATDISELAATRTSLETARDRFRRLFENLPDPIVEVEYVAGEPIVRYLNPAFADVFGYDPTAVRGENLNEFVVGEAATGDPTVIDERATAGETIRTEVTRQTAVGPREFLLQVIPHPRDGGTYAFAVYTEITEQKQREQYLQILNRVLRHNLRNDMNVVTMIAEEIAAESTDPRLSAYADQLADKARDVASVSEKAKEIERVTGETVGEIRAVDVAAQVREVTAQVAADTDTEIETDIPREAWARGTHDLQRAVTELVENAVEHGAAPTVTVRTGERSRTATDTTTAIDEPTETADEVVETTTAEPTEEVEPTPFAAVPADEIDPPEPVTDPGETGDPERPVRITIHDDGPGIPEAEWAVVTGERTITQLEHGSGLGLWLARWIVASVGGRLVRRDADADGTTIEIRLAAASPS
ncbi:PAS domain S-box protein [Halobaculum sp. MBLA0147]|uniref:PAS domain S-box protein n=1 Tax=Halobaculum sp. MBLA0147 TaxID=3079934 RepID=UPI003524508B